MASYGPALTQELRACLSNEDRMPQLCTQLEKFLDDLIFENPKDDGHTWVDGVLPENVKMAAETLSIHGRVWLGVGNKQRLEPLSGELHLNGTYSFALGNPPLILASPGEFPLVTTVYPELASKLADGLRAQGEGDLADSVQDLRYYGPCACEQPGCESFYTAPQPDGGYGDGHRNFEVVLSRRELLVIDAVGKDVMFIEVLAL